MNSSEKKKKKKSKKSRNADRPWAIRPANWGVEQGGNGESMDGGKTESSPDSDAGAHQAGPEVHPVQVGSLISVHHAVAVDPEIRSKNLKRLRRIEGQVRGLQRMVEEDLYCADIMTQIASVQEALRSVGRELVRNHMKHCAAAAIRGDDPKRAEEMHEELLDMVYRLGR